MDFGPLASTPKNICEVYMEKIPPQVANALHHGDREALHAMAVAGGKASGEKRKIQAEFKREAIAIRDADAAEAERNLNLSEDGDVLPPENGKVH